MENKNTEADNYFNENIVESRGHFDKLVTLYKSYVSKAETRKERLRRIHNFRCGGW